MSRILTTDAELRSLLSNARSVAVVGLSPDATRPSYEVADYLQSVGYEILPVNPTIEEWRGLKAYSTIESIGRKIDIVEVFRRPEHLPDVIDDAIAARPGAVWTQFGVVNDEATDRAVAEGIPVVIDRCMRVEHMRLIAHGAASI